MTVFENFSRWNSISTLLWLLMICFRILSIILLYGIIGMKCYIFSITRLYRFDIILKNMLSLVIGLVCGSLYKWIEKFFVITINSQQRIFFTIYNYCSTFRNHCGLFFIINLLYVRSDQKYWSYLILFRAKIFSVHCWGKIRSTTFICLWDCTIMFQFP